MNNKLASQIETFKADAKEIHKANPFITSLTFRVMNADFEEMKEQENERLASLDYSKSQGRMQLMISFLEGECWVTIVAYSKPAKSKIEIMFEEEEELTVKNGLPL